MTLRRHRGAVLSTGEGIADDLGSIGIGFDAVVCASGSALTHAGILVGLRALGERAPVLGICVRRDAASQGARVARVAAALAAMIDCRDAFDAGDIEVSDAVHPPGYGRLSGPTVDADVSAFRAAFGGAPREGALATLGRFDHGGVYGDALYRVAIPGFAEANRMEADLDMNGHDIAGAGALEAGTLEVETDLEAGGDLAVTGDLLVGRAVRAAGTVEAGGEMTAASARIEGAVTSAAMNVTGAVRAQTVEASGLVEAGSIGAAGAVAAGSARLGGLDAAEVTARTVRSIAAPLKVTGSGQWRAAAASAPSMVGRISWAMNEIAVPCGQGASASTTAASSLPRKQSGVSTTRQPGARSRRGPRAREETVQPRFDSA